MKAASIAAEQDLRLTGAGAAVDEVKRQQKRISGAAALVARRVFACESVEDIFSVVCPMLR